MENLEYYNKTRVTLNPRNVLIEQNGGSDMYYEKYLKYKEKYLDLKNQTGGLITFKSGMYTFFITAADAQLLCGAQFPSKAPSVASINKVLNGKGYYIKNGSTSLYKIKSSFSQFKQSASDFRKNTGASLASGAKIVSMRLNLAGKALYGNLSGDIVNQKKEQLQENLKKIAESRPNVGERKQKYTEIKKGSHPDEIELVFSETAEKKVMSVLDEEYRHAIIKKLKENDIDVDTVLVINIIPTGSNQCLSLKTY